MKRKEEKINSNINKKQIKGGNMLREINLSKIIVFVLLLTMIAAILVSDTYSRFTTTASGSDSVVVAKWAFEVNGEDIAVTGDEKTIEFGLFDTIYDSDGETKETNVAEGYIAPGTSGSFEFALQNTSEVLAEYNIELDIDNTDIPLEFSFDGQTWENDLTNLKSKDVLAIGASKNVKVMWRWQFRDDVLTDIEFADQTVNVNATITATQFDNTTEVTMLDGDGQTYYTLAPSTLSFRSSANINDFQEVQINGETIDSSNYTTI